MIVIVDEGNAVIYPRRVIVKAGTTILGYVTRANTDTGEVTVECPAKTALHYQDVIENLDPRYKVRQIGENFCFTFTVKNLAVDVI